MSEELRKKLEKICDKANQLDEGQQIAVSLIAQGMALQKELSEEAKANKNI